MAIIVCSSYFATVPIELSYDAGKNVFLITAAGVLSEKNARGIAAYLTGHPNFGPEARTFHDYSRVTAFLLSADCLRDLAQQLKSPGISAHRAYLLGSSNGMETAMEYAKGLDSPHVRLFYDRKEALAWLNEEMPLSLAWETAADSAVGLTLTYSIDADDRIVAVNDEWRGFAFANDGGADLADRVVGTKLWSWVSGDSVREIYLRLTARARKGQLVQVFYRCDTPTQRRTCAMSMEAGPRGEVKFTTDLIRAESRPAVRLLDHASERDDQFVRICSWCDRVAVGPEEWVDAEEAVNRLGLLLAERPPTLTHVMCASCEIKFSVQTESSDGSRFTVLLPGASAPGTPATEPPLSPTTLLAGEVCILLADDDEALRSSMADILELEGFKVVTARDGQEAVDLYREDPSRFQFVVIDLIMPRLDGDKAVEQMRLINPRVRVAVVSGFPSREISHRFAAAKSNEYLMKPFSIDKLLAVVKSMCPTI